MESVGKTPECVEHELGEVLAARSAATANADDVPGIGPPDLCWIQRSAKGIFNKKKPKLQGHYHWVVGLPVTSSASVAAYFARLISTVKKAGYFQGLGVGREFTISRGIYCCYDPFSDMDIWVELVLPGGAVARGLDRQGYLHDVTAEMWRGVHAGSFLRAELYDVSVTLHCSRAFQHMTFCKVHQDETELLRSVTELYASRTAQRARERLHWDKGQGTEPPHMDIICNSLLQHFKKRRRWQKALQFFTELQEHFPSSVVYQAEIYRELDNGDGAAKLLKSSLEDLKKEDHPILVIACGYVYLESGESSKASKIAQSVLNLDPQVRPAWMLLSRALMCERQYAKSLRALHLMPPPLIPSDRKFLLLRVLPPKPRFITRHKDAYNPEAAELNDLSKESRKPGAINRVLPGQVLAPRRQSHSVDWGLISGTQCVMRAAYDILLNIVHTVGWERFCETRASVFTLPGEEEGMTSEKQEWQPVRVDFVIPQNSSSRQNSVIISFSYRDSIQWEKQRPKNSSLYVRCMSYEAPNQLREADSSTLSSALDTHLATSVVERGLMQVAGKALRRPSTASTVLHDDGEQTLSPTSETFSDTPSGTSQLESQNKAQTAVEEDLEKQLSPSFDTFPSESPGKKSETSSVHHRKVVEVVTMAQQLPSDDEVPDAPENTLPQDCALYSSGSQRIGPPSSTGFSQSKWQVKIVSMGIKDRVKYFDQVAKEKIAKQTPGASLSPQFEDETCVVAMRPRRSRYSIAQTIVEKLRHDFPDADSTAEAPVHFDEAGSGDVDQGDLESSESNEALPHEADWGSFALDAASHVPHAPSSRPPTRLSLFDGFCSGAYTDLFWNGQHLAIEDKARWECAEWLDELTLALWEDLAIYTELKNLDKKLKSRNRQTHAEQILGTVEWNLDTSDEESIAGTPSAGLVLPDSRPVDWMRRGLLCERLRKLADAEQAYRVCLFLSPNTTALLALSRIYCEWGYCKGAILLLDKLAMFHHKRHSSQKEMYLPHSFVSQMSHLLESVGKKDLKMATENSHSLVTYALDDILKWNVQSAPSSRRPSASE